MSTQGILETAVQVAGNETSPTIGALAVLAKEIALIPKGLRTNQEVDILKVAKKYGANIPLIDLSLAIRAGGLIPETELPRLAVATYQMSMDRADVSVMVWRTGSVNYMNPKGIGSFARFDSGTINVRRGIFSPDPNEGQTTVPLVPRILRRSYKETQDESDLLLLFEVSEWKPVQRPADPYLLEHVSGNVYAVIGTWDVTEGELKAYQAARTLGI